MKKLLFPFLFILSFPLYSTHYMGGEITWQCLPNGNYRFTMKLYRECYVSGGSSALSFGNTETMHTTVPGLPTIIMTRISLTDMSPQCNTNPAFQPKIFCPGMSNGAANMGALQENIYTSDASFPNGVTLNGVPPPTGWEFSHRTCCRNPSTNIIGANSLGWRLRAFMFSYNGQNANPCYDSSPVFAEKPSTVICTGYPFTYNHNAFDPDLDSLTFEWAQPLLESGMPITAFAAGYSFLNPLPGTMHNPSNVPATINPNTGEISFTSFTQGAFVTVVRVTSYRCGQKVAEIFREIQIVLLPCGANNPPNVEAPFQDTITGLYTLYERTVYAGELVTFSMTGTDFEFMPNGVTPQTLTILATGGQFGAGFTSTTTGCLFPPCAILNPPPPVTAQFGVMTNFSWQTSCVHLATDVGCGNLTNRYTFLIRVMDDFCPAPAIKFSTVTINIIDSLIGHPSPRCVRTHPNGNVELTWIPPPMQPFQHFDSYHIFYSNNFAGPYTVVDSIFNYNQTSWTHNTTSGNTGQGYYYILTRSGCGKYFINEPTDTISNIFLTLNNPGIGIAQLSWNAVKNPTIPTNSPWYRIYRDPGTGVFSFIDSTLNLFYNDTIVFCNADVRYQIRQSDLSGCVSMSNIDWDNFSDITPPDTPVPAYVTVDILSQNANIQWEPSLASDVVGYIIYRFTTTWTPIDTVSTPFYTDLTGTPSLNVESYRVAAIDSCGNTSPMTVEHRTIFLTTEKDICKDEIVLTWTPYINLTNSLADYEVHYSINGSPYTFLASTLPTQTTFTHSGLLDSAQYCYYVMAVNDDGTKTPISNYRCEFALKPFQPQFAYLRYVSVIENNYVEIAMFTDTSAKVLNYKLEKSINNSGTYTTVATLSPSISPFVYYNDFQVDVENNVYTYRFVVRDSCGVDALTSNEASTILLSGEQGNELFSNVIQWTDYEGWPTGVLSYDVYRGTINPLLPDFVAQVPVGVNIYLDVFPENVMVSEGKISYYVTGNENVGNPYGFQDASTSNIIFITQPPRIYVPNAFTPGEKNPIFKPIMIFIDHQNYLFSIYNRWGKEIFTTTDINEGWDGTYKNNFVKSDVYTWILNARFANGITFERRGIVTVLN